MSGSPRRRLELGEHQTARIGGIAPTPADEALSERLAERGLIVRWLRDERVEIASSSYVGSVQFSSFDVIVVPKLVGGSLNVLRMIEYAAGVDILKRLPERRLIPAGGDDLVELICLLLVEEARTLIRRGVVRDYREVEDALGVLRGRLRQGDQLARQFNQLYPLECRFDEYDADVPDNQLLAAGLRAARPIARNPGISRACAQLAEVFLAVCTPPTVDAAWYTNTIRYTRRNQHYRSGHELATLVLGRTGFSDLFELSGGEIGAFLLDMNSVFEAFVQRLVIEALDSGGYRVAAQQRLRTVIRDDLRGRPYTSVSPDLIVQTPDDGATIPIDVKYKTYALRNVSTADIYQTFLYAYSLARSEAIPRAGIFYPATSTTREPRLSVRGTSAPTQKTACIAGVGLDVPNILSAIKRPEWPSVLATVKADVDFIAALT